MKILVTGGAGFIGSFLVDKLISLGHEVRILDNLEEQVHGGKKPDYLNPEAEFIYGDVRNYDAFKQALDGIEVVFHEAAAVGVAQSNYEVKRYVDVNVGGTANLLDIIVNDKHRTVKKILTTTSMTAYAEGLYTCPDCGMVKGELRSLDQLKQKDWQMYCSNCHSSIEPIPTPETAPQPCNSIYALSKKTQEDMLMLLGKMYSIPTIALRCFNVYGPRQSISNPYTGVTAIFISRLKNNQPPVIYEDGLQSRDFISVHDVVNALVSAMDNPQADYQVMNLGSGQSTTIKDVAVTLARLMDKDINPQITGEFRKNDIRHCYADVSQAKKILNWQPKISFDRGMKELIDWSLTQPSADDFIRAEQQLRQKGLL
jgi:dTDP-L-rhamnose 4-epimerase